jgi:hypothetical protein
MRQNSGMVCLDFIYSRYLTLVDLQTPIGLGPLEILILAPSDLPVYAKDSYN